MSIYIYLYVCKYCIYIYVYLHMASGATRDGPHDYCNHGYQLQTTCFLDLGSLLPICCETRQPVQRAGKPR